MANDHPPLDSLTLRQVVGAGHRGEKSTAHTALDHPDPTIRAAGLSALLRLDSLDAPLLERFFVDPSPEVRRRAAELAPRLPDRAAIVRGLVALLTDEPSVVEMGAFALGEIEIEDPRAVAALATTAREHTDALCRESAVAALGALHAGRETVLAALDDVATVRRRAVIALAPFDGPDIDRALTAALDDRDWQVRQAAEDLLADDRG